MNIVFWGCILSIVSSAPWSGPCAQAPDYPWCKHTDPPLTRAKSLVSNLTLKEKAVLFTNGAGSIDRIKWPGYNWWSEALHGVARGAKGVRTSYPQVIGIGATFNKTLFRQLGDLVSTEARGLANGQGKTYWAPNINIFRDPRWGRGQETPGEDPTLTSDYASNFVSGLQSDNPTYLKVSSCLKHYAAYSEETGRGGFPAVVNKQDMEDTYLPAFQSGIQHGKASGIMCSYNAETYGYGLFGEGSQNGAIPSCANKYLMTDKARTAWGFAGYITSDCGATNGVQNSHHYTKNDSDTIIATLGAGMDIDCGHKLTSDTLLAAIGSKAVSESLLDVALVHLFLVQIRLGWIDPPELVPWSHYNSSVVNTKAHQKLALEAAQESLVLLKNDKSTLPFDKTHIKKVAVIGPNGNVTRTMQGNYFGQAPFLISPEKGLESYADVSFVQGCKMVGEGAKSDCDFKAATTAAHAADAVVLVIGIDQTHEAEGHDRRSLVLPANQSGLVTEVAAVATGPVVVVVMSGGPLDISTIQTDSNVGAIMWCGYPGQTGGQAIADAIFGSSNRFGKLPVTWYPESFTKQVGIEDMGMRPNKTSGNPGRTHRFYTGIPVYEFGHGLGFTVFKMSLSTSSSNILVNIAREAMEMYRDTPSESVPLLTVRAEVMNIGDREGDEVVMLYARSPGYGQNGAPLRDLVAYERIRLAGGQTIILEFSLLAHHLSLVTTEGEHQIVPGQWQLGLNGMWQEPYAKHISVE